MTRKWTDYAFWGFCGLAILAILFFGLPKRRGPKAELGLNEDDPLLVVYADARSRTVRGFVAEVERHLRERDLNLTLALKSSSKKEFSVRDPNTRVMKIPIKAMEENQYLLLKEGSNPLLMGSVLESSDLLIEKLGKFFDIGELFQVEGYLPVGIPIRETAFASVVEQHVSTGRMSVFSFFQNICMVCGSGNTLIVFEELAKTFPDIAFNFITLTRYSDRQLADFIENHAVKIPIQIAHDTFRGFWEETSHLKALEGLILVLDPEGIVIRVIENGQLNLLEEWLSGYLDQ